MSERKSGEKQVVDVLRAIDAWEAAGRPQGAGTTPDAMVSERKSIAAQAVAALRAIDVRPGDVLEADARAPDGWVEHSALEALLAAAPDGAAVRCVLSGEVWRAIGSGEVWRCGDMGGDETVIVNSTPVVVVAWPRGGES